MTRDEHLAWCKRRALEYVAHGDTEGAWSSFLSDMNKHPETQDHGALILGSWLFFAGHLDRPGAMTRFIEGFN